jgi:hypothetical protein
MYRITASRTCQCRPQTTEGCSPSTRQLFTDHVAALGADQVTFGRGGPLVTWLCREIINGPSFQA